MKSKVATLIAIICSVVIIGSALGVAGIIGIRYGTFSVQAAETEKEQAAGYVKYMETFVIIGAEGHILSTQTERPDDIPKIEGVSLSSMVIGREISTPDVEAMDYVWKLMKLVSKYNITGVWEYYISGSLEATIYADNIAIQFGKDKDTEAKFDDLSNFYDKVIELDGTLNMQKLSELNLGYTFRTTVNSTENLIAELSR